MTITIDRFKACSSVLGMRDGATMKQATGQTRAQSGFTLVEIIVATSLSLILLASVFATFLSFAESIKKVGAYSEMNQQSRFLLETFARDVRVAEDITAATANSIVIQLPSTAPYNGNTVEYTYDSGLEIFSRLERDSGGVQVGASRILLDGVTQFAFSYFNPLGDALDISTDSLLLSVKGVQLEAELYREVIGSGVVSEYVISGRFTMRNRPVTQ